MAFGANTSKWYFVGDSTSLERSTRRSEDALERLNRTGKTAFGGLGSAANLLTGALGVGGLAYGIKSLTDAAKESELASIRMQTQFRALGLDFEQHRQRVEDVIQAQSRLAALDDEELSDSFTTILRVTGDVNRSLELNALAADIARGKQIDLASAGEIVAKVAGGNVGILSRYGISIEKGASATEALGELQRLFAGQAEEYGASNAGAAERAAVAWENAREELGARLLPILSRVATFIADDLIPAVSSFAGWVDDLVEKIGGWKVALGFILSGLLASRILAAVEAVKALTVATAAAGVASAASAGGAVTAWGKLGTLFKVGLPAALAVGLVAMRDKIREEVPELVEDVRTNFFGELTDEETKRILENNGVKAATSYSDGVAEKLSKLGPQVFAPVWQDVQTFSKIAALDTGEESGEEFIEGVREKLSRAFPTAVLGALAPTWDDIRKAAEAAGMDVGSAFTAGFQTTAQVTNGQFGPNTLNSYATSQGAQGASVANAVNYALSQQGVPYVWGGGRSGGPDSGSGLAVDRGQQGFDCSGLIYAAYKRAGVTVPGTSQAWLNWPHKVASIGDLMPGDVIVTNGGEHVVMYIGNNMVIAASGGPSGGGNDKVLIQSLDYHRSGIVGMFRPVPGAQVSAGAIDDVVASTVPGSEPRPSVPGRTSSPSTSSAPTPRPQTSFPGIAGISDSLRSRFDAANQQEGKALQYDPATGKFRAVKVGPDLKAMKKLADHIRTKVLPPLQKQINTLRARIKRMAKNKRHDKVLLASLKNKLAALVDERDEIVAFWREVIDTWKDMKATAAEDDDTGEPPTEAYDFSGPVGEPVVVGLPQKPADPADTPDTSADLAAELDQANRRAAVAQRAAQLAAGIVSSIGIGVDAAGDPTATIAGGPTIVVQSLQLPNADWLAELGRHVSMAASGQGFQPSTSENLGV